MTGHAKALVPFTDSIASEGQEPSLRTTVICGFAVVALFVGAFLGWSLFANLDSAVVAKGAVVVDSHRKTVQHLEGGILRQLFVREGDEVREGQLLAELDSTQASAALGQARNQHWAVKARLARLRAELAGKRTISFPQEMAGQAQNTIIGEAMTAQRQLFDARWRAHDGTVEILRKRKAQLADEIDAEKALAESASAQRQFTKTELANVERLYKKGYERLPRVLQLRRSAADLKGREMHARSNIERLRRAIASADLEIMAAMDRREAEVGRELQEALALDANLADRVRAAADVKDRNAIYAPQAGTVVDLKVFTTGGVIAPGQPIMDIVPSNDSLVIEAKVSPSDIEAVHDGLAARVHLTAYKRSKVPAVLGRVIHVSADQLTDPRSETPYFTTRIKLDARTLAKLDGVKLQPGMPAEVMIVTGERRAIDYFIAPLTERMRRAFREQ